MPWALWQAYGHEQTLRDAYPLMTAHTRSVAAVLAPDGVWDTGFQFGDWLDPDAPADDPGKSKAPSEVVATASAFRTATLMAEAAAVLGEHADAAEFAALRDRIGDGFRRALCARTAASRATARPPTRSRSPSDCCRMPTGRRPAIASPSSSAPPATASAPGSPARPFVNDALTVTGHLDDAYALLLQREAPSWLYAVTMGATTIWERWDSMLPDGSINPGEMTSFNHYAFGAVADWMHRSVAGLAPARARIPPHPRRTAARRRADLGGDEPRDAARARGRAVGPRRLRAARRGDRARGRRGGAAAARAASDEIVGAGTHVRTATEGVNA